MTKLELIKKLAEESNLTTGEATKFLNSFVEVVKNELKQGNEVAITGFGTFKVSERAERKSRNPQTGEDIIVPATKAPTFKASKNLKELLK